MISNSKLTVESEVQDDKGYSISILKSEGVFQYKKNLLELLPKVYPNVHLENKDMFYRLWGENGTELLTVFSALIDAMS